MKIYLSPSAQPENRYAYGNTNEQEQCNRIAEATETALKRNGFEVLVGGGDSLGARCTQANNWGANLYIPIHTNAFDGKVSGTRIFCYNTTGEGYKASKNVFNALAPVTPGTSESVSTNRGLYEVKTPKAPTVYIEVDFHDVPEVAKWIVEHTEDIGEAICEGVCAYSGVDYTSSMPVETPATEPTAASQTIYRVQVGAYSVRENAEAMQNWLKGSGFDAIIV